MAQTDLIAIQIPKSTWQEGSAFILTAFFRLRSTAAAVTPTTIRYRLDGLTTGTTILDWTTVTPAGNISITVTGAQNKVQNDSNQIECKQITIEADQGLDTQYRESKVWTINNLFGTRSN